MALPDSCCDFVMTRLMTFVLVPSSAFFSQLKIDTSSFFLVFLSLLQILANVKDKCSAKTN